MTDEKPRRQSGMEAKHEDWVLATLNFLHSLDVPSDLEIPERLSILHKRLVLAEHENAGRALRIRDLEAQVARHRDLASKLAMALGLDGWEFGLGDVLPRIEILKQKVADLEGK